MPNQTAIAAEGLAARYEPGDWIAPHDHDANQIIHASAGVLRVLSERDSWVVPPGRAIWMPAGRIHGIRCQSAVEMRTVYLRGLAPGLPSGCAVWSVSPLMREILVRLASEPEPRRADHLLSLLLCEIEVVTSLPFHLPLPSEHRIRRLTDAVTADPADARHLNEWARELGLSERNLIRRFQAETGMTFRQWRRQARLLRALERLAAGESVTAVTFAVGYESVSAFIAAFREAFGETPRRFQALRDQSARGRIPVNPDHQRNDAEHHYLDDIPH
jgi:AraC-like DNA-binding protein